MIFSCTLMFISCLLNIFFTLCVCGFILLFLYVHFFFSFFFFLSSSSSSFSICAHLQHAPSEHDGLCLLKDWTDFKLLVSLLSLSLFTQGERTHFLFSLYIYI